MTPSDSKQYAQELLRLNPHDFAQQIVERRARYLGLDNAASTKADNFDLPRRRQIAEAALAEIRSDFWTAPLAELKSRLADLNLEGLPDLAASAARLAETAEVRPEFQRLYAERKINKPFIDELRKILVLPLAAAGQRKVQKENTLHSWRELRSAKRTVRSIARKFPRIYQLEREWLDQIASAKRFAKAEVRRTQPSSNSKSASHNYWVIWVVIMILLSLFRGLFGK